MLVFKVLKFRNDHGENHGTYLLAIMRKDWMSGFSHINYVRLCEESLHKDFNISVCRCRLDARVSKLVQYALILSFAPCPSPLLLCHVGLRYLGG